MAWRAYPRLGIFISEWNLLIVVIRTQHVRNNKVKLKSGLYFVTICQRNEWTGISVRRFFPGGEKNHGKNPMRGGAVKQNSRGSCCFPKMQTDIISTSTFAKPIICEENWVGGGGKLGGGSIRDFAVWCGQSDSERYQMQNAPALLCFACSWSKCYTTLQLLPKQRFTPHSQKELAHWTVHVTVQNYACCFSG